MQTTEDGEYIPCTSILPLRLEQLSPTKELEKGFKIPKKGPDEEKFGEMSQAAAPAPVLENSYYNSAGDPTQFFAPTVIEATRNFILQNLEKREYEKPKTYNNNILKDTVPDCFDESLPRELTALFQPLYCKLCTAQLSSNVVAKLHYKSRNHEKNIRKFLIKHSEESGEPLHKRAKMEEVKKTEEEEKNPMWFYCDVCDLPLTGKLHAESHYMGKNHRKATLGIKSPAGKGHYSPDGKWVRNSGKPREVNGDGFGVDFRTVQTCALGPPPPPSSSNFRCDICDVTTTCQQQLESHYNGQKHRKKLRQQMPGLASQTLQPQDLYVADTAKRDCSVYRTPSGQYYCPTCNSTMNSEMQFKQHLQSKNHLKKAAQKKN